MTSRNTVTTLEKKSLWLRNQILDLVYTSKHGHIGGAFSCVEILVALYYTDLLKDSKFILSKGHACVALYSILADKGIITQDELQSFCQNDGLSGHPVRGKGVEIDSGSLGHGLGIAAGMALTGQKVIVLIGDGELYEGSTWEALLFIAHHKLNVTLIIDRNQQTVLDFTEKNLKLDPLRNKLESFGWDTLEIDGHDLKEIQFVLSFCKLCTPLCIIADTVKGKGVSFFERSLRWHHSIPTKEEYELANKELNGH
jgi:transketolase